MRISSPDEPFAQAKLYTEVVDYLPAWVFTGNGFPFTKTDVRLPSITPPGWRRSPRPDQRTLSARLTGYGAEQVNLPVVSAVLAPGAVGIYRISLRLPDSLPADFMGFFVGTIEIGPPGPFGVFSVDSVLIRVVPRPE